MQIYWFKAQAPLRVLALAKHLGVEAELVEVDMMAGGLRTDAYAALNAHAKAPTLVDNGKVIWESAAIMAYLCVHAGSDMWPANNPDEQIEVLRWLSWCEGHWSQALAPWYFEHIVKPTFDIGPLDPTALAGAADMLHRFAPTLEGQLRAEAFVACGRLTIADFHLASIARYWRETGTPLENYPAIIAWLERLADIPAWADPWPPSRYALR